MKWSEREYFILRILAAVKSGEKLTPELLRAYVAESDGKTTADVDALLKAQVRQL